MVSPSYSAEKLRPEQQKTNSEHKARKLRARIGEPPGDSKDLLVHFMFCKMALVILPEARVLLIRVNLGDWEKAWRVGA